RDFLYARMRGARGMGPAATGAPSEAASAAGPPVAGDTTGELAATLRQAVAELRAIRKALEARGGSADG
ncbi:MAG: hypothetical protein KAJ97_04520, partial [Acidobacteria bacterium]|nr:hypothetical protein [Acidobacteriota bacterium]